MMSGPDSWGTPPETLAAVGAGFWSGDILGLVTRLQTLLAGAQSLTCELTDSGVRLRWATVAGRTYQLESAADLATGPWASFVSPVTGTGD